MTGTGSPAPRSAPIWGWSRPNIPPGASRSQGAITKTGNTHARRLLVEAAWHHRRPYNHASRDMRSRWDAADEASRVRGHQGNHRLHQKWEQFEARHKRPGYRERRHRPGTGRLVLVPGRPGPTGTAMDAMNRRVPFPADARNGSAAWRRPAITTMGNRQTPVTPDIARPAAPLQPNTSSCGNQPAHISLTAPSPTRR